ERHHQRRLGGLLVLDRALLSGDLRGHGVQVFGEIHQTSLSCSSVVQLDVCSGITPHKIMGRFGRNEPWLRRSSLTAGMLLVEVAPCSAARHWARRPPVPNATLGTFQSRKPVPN